MSSPKTFAELGVPARLVEALTAMDRTEPFPIQSDTLPDSLSGTDVLGRGKTGSGKTLAFAIPLVARLTGTRRRPSHPSGLVLAPTRELATQIDATVAPLAAAAGLTTTTIFGGVKQTRQVQALRAGVDIVVACPGRLEDLMKQGLISLDSIAVTVIDEADHMADLGFLPSVSRILTATPTTGQRMLFSATLDNGVDTLVKRFLHDPVLHSVDEANSPVAAMTHHIFDVKSQEEKKAVVHALASGLGRRILFTRTKHQAKKLAQQLTKDGIPAVDLQGNLSQAARERNLAAFSDGGVRVLVATDVAARGVHVDDVELVVHVDPPTESKAYLHRSGRTARAGHAGDVVTLVLPEQRRDVAALLRGAKISAKPEQVTARADAVTTLVGEVAPFVAPAPRADPPQQPGRSQGANARRKRAARSEGGAAAAGSQGAGRRSGSGGSAQSRADGQQARGAGRSDQNGRGARTARDGKQASARSSSGGRSSAKGGAAEFSRKSGVGQLAGVRGRSGRSGGR